MNPANFLKLPEPFRLMAGLLLAALCCFSQKDPGARGGSAGAGGYYSTLGFNEQSAFTTGSGVFQEVEGVPNGLGPTFNGNSCAMCHAEPAVGGSSPGMASPQHSVPNPQVALATLDGAANSVPSFITASGPVREARFVSTNPSNPAAPLDGGVHGLYTIQGRGDAVGCTLAQPNFAAALGARNVIFRIPTPTFGLGLVEDTPDATLQANLVANSAQKSQLGVRGQLNTSGNDGTVTRFGWKAQNKSLMVFAGEAYNVEMGVSNEVFPNERSAVSGCVFNPTPEDYTAPGAGTNSDVVNFAMFMRLSAPPAPTTATASELNGQNLFSSVGCALCHSTSLTTGRSEYTGMSNVTYHPYSDFALHHMGANLADGINQGAAGPDQFRTAPLWGVGQRLFFLHDGRTSDLLQAIEAHFSPNRCESAASFSFNQVCGSEANAVIGQFNALSDSAKQDILNFLRSL